MFIEVSPGELIDRISILELKVEHVTVPERKAGLQRELAALHVAFGAAQLQLAELAGPVRALQLVNRELWNIEDAVRECERLGDFGVQFVELARSVYRRNDERAALKRRINELCGSALLEEKVYRSGAARNLGGAGTAPGADAARAEPGGT